MTGIPPGMIEAYRETEYRVDGNPGFVLCVDEPSPDLLRAHARHGVDCSAFVTACNPYSESLDKGANIERNRQLADELTRNGLAFLPGVGQHPTSGWAGEPSFLVFGLGLEAARALGVRWDQNAIVWSGADGVPGLRLLR